MAKGRSSSKVPDQDSDIFEVSEDQDAAPLETDMSEDEDGKVIQVDFKNKLREPPKVKKIGTENLSERAKTRNEMFARPDPGFAAAPAPGGSDLREEQDPFLQEPPTVKNLAEAESGMNTTPRNEAFGHSLQLKSDSLSDSDITNVDQSQEKTTSEPATELAPEQQQAAALDLSRRRQEDVQTQIKSAKAETASEGAAISGQFLSGPLLEVARRLPGIGSLLNQFEAAGALPQKIALLSTMIGVLKIAKVGAAITDAVIQMSELTAVLFAPTFGLVLFVTIFMAPIMVLLYAVLTDTLSPMAKSIAKIITITEALKTQLEATYARSQKKKMAASRINQMEVLAANEAMTADASEAAAA